MLKNTQHVLTAVSMLAPSEIDLSKIRIGPACDGGYILADRFQRNPILSFGAGSDISFEIELADRGHEIFLFDHTVPVLPDSHHRVKHFLKGIAGSPTVDNLMVDLNGAIALAGLTNRNDLILKLDVEGCEFNALNAAQSLQSFEQIAIEIHWLWQLPDEDFRRYYNIMMSNLLKDFTIFHVHGNNCASLRFVGGEMTDAGQMGGIPVLDVVELSLIRNDLVTRSENQTSYPTEFDFPNRPDRPDHILWFYPYNPLVSS